MIRTLLIIFSLFFCYPVLLAQKQLTKNTSPALSSKNSSPFKSTRTKQWQSNIAIGFGGSLYNFKIGGEPLRTILLSTNYDSVKYYNLPVIMGTYDFKILDFLSIGAAYSYQNLNYSYSVYRTDSITYRGDFTDRVQRSNIGVRLLYHFRDTEDIDIYSGVRVGYTKWKMHRIFEDDFVGYKNNKYKIQGIIGARGFVHKNIGVMLEAGIGEPYFWTIGICVRL